MRSIPTSRPVRLAAAALALAMGATLPAQAQDATPTPSQSPSPSESPSPSPSPTPTGTPVPDDGWPLRAPVRDAVATAPPMLLDGSGFGHGVGLSQYGAYALGLDGRSAADILAYYYRGTQVLDRPDETSVPIKVGLFQSVTTSTIIATVGAEARWQTCPTSGGTTTCAPLQVDGEPLVVPAGETWRVGYVVTDPDDPAAQPTFGIRTQDGRVVPAGSNRLRLRSPSPDGHLFGPMPNSSSPVDFLHGFHEFVDEGASFDVVHEEPTIESYLKGLAEVPSSWGLEAPTTLQAQAIAGRTYAVRLRDGGIKSSCSCHILATPANQNWTAGQKERGLFGEQWVAGVQDSAGRLVAFEGELIATFYSSSHGGRSENIEDSWAYGTTPFSYLRSIDDPWSLREEVNGTPVGNNRRAWTVTVPNVRLAALVGVDEVTRLRVLSRTEGGTPREVAVDGVRAGEPVSFTWTRPAENRKRIAGANMRLDLLDADGVKLPSSQIRGFRFGPFSDDDGSLFEAAISFVASAGIAQGVGDGAYAPGLPVTRGEMARFLNATVRLPEGGDNPFSDVPDDGPFTDDVVAVAEGNVTRGYADGTFRPSGTIIRAEFASFLARTFGLEAAEPDPGFADVAPAGTHAAAIAAVAEAGITLGCDADRFCPEEPVTRGQMAEFLRRAVRHVLGTA